MSFAAYVFRPTLDQGSHTSTHAERTERICKAKANKWPKGESSGALHEYDGRYLNLVINTKQIKVLMLPHFGLPSTQITMATSLNSSWYLQDETTFTHTCSLGSTETYSSTCPNGTDVVTICTGIAEVSLDVARLVRCCVSTLPHGNIV